MSSVAALTASSKSPWTLDRAELMLSSFKSLLRRFSLRSAGSRRSAPSAGRSGAAASKGPDARTLLVTARLTLACATHDEIAVLIADGGIDMSSAPDLGTALALAITPAGTLIADLSGIRFMGSWGLHTLAKAHRDAQAQRCRLLIVPSPAVARVFQVTETESAFYLQPAMTDALRLAHAEH